MNLGVLDLDAPQLEMKTIEKVTYKTIIKLVPSFVSLDISLTGTGWSRWHNGVLTQGCFKIEAPEEDSVGRRREFRENILSIFDGAEFEYLFIEDVIGSVNFKTAVTLYQLNPLADDMVADGIIHAKTIIREDNNKWKKYLKLCSGYQSPIRADSDDKRIIRDALHLLDFGDRTTNTIVQDIYDSLGLAVGVIYRLIVMKEEAVKKKLKKDIAKVYKINQFYDYYEALDNANAVGGEIKEVDFLNIKRDLKYNFKRMIEETDDDTKTYLISVLTCKIGAVAIEKGLDLDMEVSYLVVYRKGKTKKK